MKNKKKVYFHDGLTEYKAIIVPLFIAQDKVAFAEKVIPFAYQRSSNVHFITSAQLPQYLSFLERKAINQVKYSEFDNTIEVRGNLYDRFLTQIQYTSLAFLPIAFLLMIMGLIYIYQFFVPMIGLEITALTGYGLVLAYFYIKYAQQKQSITADTDDLTLGRSMGGIDETDLELMSSEFTREEMNQLLYEIFGKGAHVDTSRFNTRPSEPSVSQSPTGQSQNKEEKSEEKTADPLMKKYHALLNE
jgi:hypothetical protein